jgi:hypothetical protein
MGKFAKAFVHNRDGSWTCVAPVTLEEPWMRRLQVAVGSRFIAGQRFMNIDVAGLLDRQALEEESGRDFEGSAGEIAA